MQWMIKGIRLLLKIVIISLLCNVITIGTTAVVVDRYIQAVLHQFHIPFEPPPLTLASILTHVRGSHTEKNTNFTSPQLSNKTLPVMGAVKEDQHSITEEKIILPPEQLFEHKNKLSKTKKEQVFTTLIKKLPQEAWQRISILMEGGLTASEIIEAEQILATYLNDKEYKQMHAWIMGQTKTEQVTNNQEKSNHSSVTP